MQADDKERGKRQQKLIYQAAIKAGVEPVELAKACGLSEPEFIRRCGRDGEELTRADMRAIADRLQLTSSQAMEIFFDDPEEAQG